MLLRQGNRLAIELPDLFSIDLPREGSGPSLSSFWITVSIALFSPYLLPPLRRIFLEFPKLNASISSTIGKTSQHGR
jgi:hypothetical protein